MRIKLYNTLALPALLYGSQKWTIKARDPRRITAAEMKSMRKTAEYTWTNYKTNTEIYIHYIQYTYTVQVHMSTSGTVTHYIG
jgi:hypothetical protein